MIRPGDWMVKTFALFLFVGFSTVFQIRTIRAQTEFGEVEGLLNRAREEGAELLSPKSFQASEAEYQKAIELRDKGKSLKEINAKIENAKQIAQSVLNNIKLAEVTFSDVLPARERAVRAKADEYVPLEWNRAEEEFRGVVIGLEEGKVKQAKEKVGSLADLYNSVELAAIKEDMTGSAKALASGIEKEVFPWAPKTYQIGLDKIGEASKLLETDRYNREDAEILIQEAEYELRHAKALSQRVSTAQGMDIESVLLGFEESLRRLAESIGVPVAFDGDIDGEVSKMVEASRTLQARNRELSSELLASREEMEESRQLKASLQERLEEERQKKERLIQIQNLFTSSEATVSLDEKNRIVLRLAGFSFPPGTAVIEPVYFDLLSRVQKAVMVYPDARVTIEGHTDSMGDEAQNKALSQSRAEAIRQYLVANLGLEPTRNQAIGYGEERPIANNETEEGRALNRRVDVIIAPSS